MSLGRIYNTLGLFGYVVHAKKLTSLAAAIFSACKKEVLYIKIARNKCCEFQSTSSQ